MDNFDLTPDPKVLIALTHTPLQPLDALCELIDNALDSFGAARLQGNPVTHPLVLVELPGRSEVERGDGMVRIRDNGQGLTSEQAQMALRAGYSGNNPYDNLGLFGMGFNISTGKIGRMTRFMTARREDAACLETLVDLVAMQEAKSYSVPVRTVPKPQEFEHGTVVEIRGWWPEGNPNAGFIKKLAGYGRSAIRREIGRRYATILRRSEVRILVNGESCDAFEHCVWHDSRFVERKGHGQIPAVFNVNHVLGTQTRCIACTAKVDASGTCPACGGSSFRTIEERVRGWVGIQRFDDQTVFGVDLIRNGRAIRIDEKSAFFEFTDEFKKTTKDYPIDSPFGRIVGEIHLDHVPVDFLKQDFQRSSAEWQRATEFLRGSSSLQPTQPGAGSNDSPIFKLYQGYRRVRKPGKTDMYMGFWDPQSGPNGGPKRISRDIEAEYYIKFSDKLPGYYDDTEWWKLVEQADQPPLEELVECPSCHAHNLKEQEVCSACEQILIGKNCVNSECQKTIVLSAVSCPHCGTSQIPEMKTPWRCEVCSAANPADRDVCGECGKPRGTPDPLSREFLLNNSDKDDELSLAGFSVELPDHTYSSPIDVVVFLTRAPMNTWESPALPLLAFKGERLEVFVDKSHTVFKFFGVRPEVLIASEVAQYLYDFNRRFLTSKYQAFQSISNLTWIILNAAWSERLRETAERIRTEIEVLFDTVRKRLASGLGEAARDIFDELTDGQKSKMISRLIARGDDLARIAELRDSGEFVTLLDSETLVGLFKRFPEKFFDGAVWHIAYVSIPELPEAVLAEAQTLLRTRHANCLEDALAFEKNPANDSLTLIRARASLDLLVMRMD